MLYSTILCMANSPKSQQQSGRTVCYKDRGQKTGEGALHLADLWLHSLSRDMALGCRDALCALSCALCTLCIML